MRLTDKQIDLARHALGLDGRRMTSYRNYFVTGMGSPDYLAWTGMVSIGHAQQLPASVLTGGDSLFRMTLAGAKAVLRRGESLCSEDFPTTPTEGGAA